MNMPHSKDGATPLYATCSKGHAQCAKLLLEKGAVVDQRRSDGLTPLAASCANGHLECAQALVAHGASLDALEDMRPIFQMAFEHVQTLTAELRRDACLAMLEPRRAVAAEWRATVLETQNADLQKRCVELQSEIVDLKDRLIQMGGVDFQSPAQLSARRRQDSARRREIERLSPRTAGPHARLAEGNSPRLLGSTLLGPRVDARLDYPLYPIAAPVSAPAPAISAVVPGSAGGSAASSAASSTTTSAAAPSAATQSGEEAHQLESYRPKVAKDTPQKAETKAGGKKKTASHRFGDEIKVLKLTKLEAADEAAAATAELDASMVNGYGANDSARGGSSSAPKRLGGKADTTSAGGSSTRKAPAKKKVKALKLGTISESDGGNVHSDRTPSTPNGSSSSSRGAKGKKKGGKITTPVNLPLSLTPLTATKSPPLGSPLATVDELESLRESRVDKAQGPLPPALATVVEIDSAPSSATAPWELVALAAAPKPAAEPNLGESPPLLPPAPPGGPHQQVRVHVRLVVDVAGNPMRLVRASFSCAQSASPPSTRSSSAAVLPPAAAAATPGKPSTPPLASPKTQTLSSAKEGLAPLDLESILAQGVGAHWSPRSSQPPEGVAVRKLFPDGDHSKFTASQIKVLGNPGPSSPHPMSFLANEPYPTPRGTPRSKPPSLATVTEADDDELVA